MSKNINIYDLVFLKPSLKIKYINGIRKNKQVIYAPRKWKVIMLAIKCLPKIVFNRLNI